MVGDVARTHGRSRTGRKADMLRREGKKTPAPFIILTLLGIASLSGCAGGGEMSEILRQALASPVTKSHRPLADHPNPILIVMTYGYGCSATGPGNGLRSLAQVIRKRYPNEHVITRSWSDTDDIAETVEKFPGRVVLIGHSAMCRDPEVQKCILDVCALADAGE